MNGLEKEPGAAVLFAVNKEFGKSVDWLLTGKAFVESKKVRQGDGNLLLSTLETSVNAPAQLRGIYSPQRPGHGRDSDSLTTLKSDGRTALEGSAQAFRCFLGERFDRIVDWILRGEGN